MKKVLVSILAAIAIFCMQIFGTHVQAANIDEATARQCAQYYISVKLGYTIEKPAKVELAYTFMNKDLNVPAAYLFNVADEGYVVIAGSDLWYPVLGYSTEGSVNVDNMAPAFKDYMEGLCNYITYAQNTNTLLVSTARSEWDDLFYQKLPAEKSPKAKTWLMNTLWNQGDNRNPTYNKFCPSKESYGSAEYAVVGCVATAMSQIMAYWKYPLKSTGYKSYRAKKMEKFIKVDFSAFSDTASYEYDKMSKKLVYNSPDSVVDAVAMLCYHAGVSVEMQYGIDASGAFSKDVVPGFTNIFKYDPEAKYIERVSYDGTVNYSDDEWVALLTRELEEKHPVYYAGVSDVGEGRDAGGHAFVCDGISSTDPNKFHFNWGWGGEANGHCDVRHNDLPAQQYNFRVNQSMVIGLKPYVENSDTTLAIQSEEIELGVAYPNPAVSQLNIPYELNNQDVSVMSVYGVDGRLVENIELNPAENRVVINVSKYPQGIYIYRLGNKANKFVVR